MLMLNPTILLWCVGARNIIMRTIVGKDATNSFVKKLGTTI